MPRDYEPGTPFLQLADTLLKVDRENQDLAFREKSLKQHLDQTKQGAAMNGWLVKDDGSIERDPTFAERQGQETRKAGMAAAGVEEADIPGQLTPEQIMGAAGTMPGQGRSPDAMESVADDMMKNAPSKKGFRSRTTQETMEEVEPGKFLEKSQADLYRRGQKAKVEGEENRSRAIRVQMQDGTWIELPPAQAATILGRREGADTKAAAKADDDESALIDAEETLKALSTGPQIPGSAAEAQIAKMKGDIAGLKSRIARKKKGAAPAQGNLPENIRTRAEGIKSNRNLTREQKIARLKALGFK